MIFLPDYATEVCRNKSRRVIFATSIRHLDLTRALTFSFFSGSTGKQEINGTHTALCKGAGTNHLTLTLILHSLRLGFATVL